MTMEIKDSFPQLLSESFEIDHENYERARGQLLDLDNQFRAWMATEIRPALERVVINTPTPDIVSKRRLASWLNQELGWLRLAVKCPRTGNASRVEANSRPNKPNAGMYRFETIDSAGSKRTVRHYCDFLTELDVVPDTLERLFFSRSNQLPSR